VLRCFRKHHLLFADTHVLPDKKLGRSESNPLSLDLHPTPYCEDVSIDQSRRRHTSCRVICFIVKLAKFWRNVYIAEKFEDVKNLKMLSLIFLWALSRTTHFTSGFLQNWNWMPAWPSMSWNNLFRNSLPLSERNHTGRRESSSRNRDRYTEVIAGPLFVFTRTRCRYFEENINYR